MTRKRKKKSSKEKRQSDQQSVKGLLSNGAESLCKPSVSKALHENDVKDVNSKLQVDKKKIDFHAIVLSIICSIIASIIVAGVAFFINASLWEKQRSAMLYDKLIDKRFQIIDEFSLCAARYTKLSKHRIRYSLIIKQEQEKHGNIPLEKVAEITERIKKAMPLEYEKAMESEEFLPELTNKSVLAQLYFGENTKKAILEMWDVIEKNADEYIEEYLAKMASESATINDVLGKNEEGYFINVKDLKLIGIMDQDLKTKIEKALNAMKSELYTTTSR